MFSSSISGIAATGREGAPGVYVDAAKIASVGLRVRRHCCYHGVSINVNVDLEPFSRINPCGYPGLDVVRTVDLHGPENVASAATIWCAIQVAKRPEMAGKRVVVVAASTTERYLSTPLAESVREEVANLPISEV